MNIKKHRIDAGMTQAETVKALIDMGIECDVSLLSRLENGVTEKAEIIEQALDALYASKTTINAEKCAEINSGDLQVDILLSLIPSGRSNAISRKSLVDLMGISDRQVRKLIKDARRFTPIINLQNGKGYFIPTEEEKPLVDKWLKQETSRAKTTFWAMRGAREFLNT